MSRIKRTEFSISKAISTGWELAKKNFWFYAGLIILSNIPTIVDIFLQDPHKTQYGLLRFILTLVSWYVTLGMLRINLLIIKGKKVNYSNLISPIFLYWRYLLVTLLVGLFTVLGLILLVVPGIIVVIALQFSTYLLVDKNMGVWKSIQTSFELTKGKRLKLFNFGLVCIGINILGALLIGVGLFLTIPVTAFASAYVYLELTKNK